MVILMFSTWELQICPFTIDGGVLGQTQRTPEAARASSAAAALHDHVLVVLQHHLLVLVQVEHRDGGQLRRNTAWPEISKDSSGKKQPAVLAICLTCPILIFFAPNPRSNTMFAHRRQR